MSPSQGGLPWPPYPAGKPFPCPKAPSPCRMLGCPEANSDRLRNIGEKSRYEERGKDQPWHSFNKALFIQTKSFASTYYLPRCPESAWNAPPPVIVPGRRLSQKGCEPGKVALRLRPTLKELTGAGCLLTSLPQLTSKSFLDGLCGWSICLFTTHLIWLEVSSQHLTITQPSICLCWFFPQFFIH